ncbi:MAG: DUF481 domain-containing protein [Candidatus Omnitrophica bacterium]|nr:DUF481 domain-containing protein [Candidatus Omnitrophota bacterium]
MSVIAVMACKVCMILSLFFIWQIDGYSEEIHLKNGDRVSGEIIGQSDENISVETDSMGTILIKRDFVDYIDSVDKETLAEAEEKLWQREISLGYNKSSGNTQNNQFSLRFYANRKTDHDEFTIKADNFYSSSNKKMDTQKWYGMGRYAFSFWKNKWYNFYKIEGSHDRFANIDYRIVSATGMGYWFSDQPDWKAMVEVGVGLEHTNFRDTTKDSNEMILVPGAFFEKKLFAGSRISQDLVLYPYLEDMGKYRLYSETSLVNPINDKLSLQLSLIADYNSTPPKDTKKRDMRLISSLTYAF